MKKENQIRFKSSEFNNDTQKTHIPHECRFAHENFRFLQDCYIGGRARDVGQLPKNDNHSVICIGSGSTLDDAIPHLKKWQGKIMCSASHYSTLMYHGIVPDYVVTIDARQAYECLVIPPDMFKIKTVLCATPGTHAMAFKHWHGKIALFRKKEINAPYYDQNQYWAYPWIVTQLLMFGSVSPAIVGLASFLGFKKAFLVGMDFAMTHNKSRHDAWVCRYEGTTYNWHAKPGANVTPHDDWVQYPNGAVADPVTNYYKLNFYSMLLYAFSDNNSEIEIINCGADNALYELPYIPIEKVVNKQGRVSGGWKRDKYYTVAEQINAAGGKYVVKYKDGIQILEADKLDDFRKYMETMQKRFNLDIDIEKNMERITYLYNTYDSPDHEIYNHQAAIDLQLQKEKRARKSGIYNS